MRNLRRLSALLVLSTSIVLTASPALAYLSNTEFEARTKDNINAKRTAQGLNALSPGSCADTVAEAWTQHLIAVGGTAPRSGASINSQCGSSGANMTTARGCLTPTELVSAWYADGASRQAILGDYNYVGVGSDFVSGCTKVSVAVYLKQP